jgi:NAD(P)-dependent dehydrogenase (short-subunit alcohol dehydrogenase family)
MMVQCDRFSGKVVIVTGAASGIGLATAKRFSGEGANVVIADLHAEKSQEAAASVPNALGLACDVSKEDQVKDCVEETLKQLGRLDIVVNNAGLMVFKPLAEHTADDWLKVLHVDLMGAFFFTKEAFRAMTVGGSIVNIASIHAVETTPLVASYAAAKAAMLSLTRSTAIEGQALGIRANCVLPGAVDTPMLWENPNIKSGAEKIDAKDVGKPEQLADAIAYLASDEASFVTGATLRVDGGRLGRL